jgi:hypothetical protein
MYLRHMADKFPNLVLFYFILLLLLLLLLLFFFFTKADSFCKIAEVFSNNDGIPIPFF